MVFVEENLNLQKRKLFLNEKRTDNDDINSKMLLKNLN
jgi:hypothetical protein